MTQQFPDETVWMDRLVEGELDEPSRRALLLRLDAQPDGWRRLALAFLEAQAWRSALGAVAAEGLEPSPRPTRRATPWTAARPWLARAAGILAVFAVGWGLGRSNQPPAHDPSGGAGVIVATTHPADPVPPPVPIPAADPTPAPVPERPPAPEVPEEYVQAPAPASASAPPADSAAALLLSRQAQERLRQRGFEVQRRPALAAVQLQDGRQAVIPVEDVMVRYVGSRIY